MGRPKKKPGAAAQPELTSIPVAAQPVEAAPQPAPVIEAVEYTPVGESGLWRVERFELLAAEFSTAQHQFDPSLLPALHTFAARYVRGWMICRRLFGIAPVVLPLNGDPDDYRVLGRAELCATLGVEPGQLNAELEALRSALWKPSGRLESDGTVSPSKAIHGSTEPRPTGKGDVAPPLIEEEGALLRRHGFSEVMFTVAGRATTENAAERAAFVDRLRVFEKVLTGPATARLARLVLLGELRLRRNEQRQFALEALRFDDEREERARANELKELVRAAPQLADDYERQLKQLDELAPWWNVTGKTVSFAGCVADMIKGIQEYQRDESTRLIDGIMTAAEVQVELRMSEQAPDPRYRLGLVTYLNLARDGIWDPNWKSEFSVMQLALLDAGFKEAVRRLAEERGMHMPDLEADGPAGEYDEDKAEG